MSVSEPAHELPADGPEIPDDLAEAIESARRGEVTHLTIHGERVAMLVPEIPEVPDFIRRGVRALLAKQDAEDAEDAAEADESWDDPGEDTPWEQVKAELGI